ncbi:unnamed protein product [Rotaria sordida]|uniref:Uncharacterized protein n=1 Tax=Rotaria sordida TaxID=392033 RepID=A0A813SJI3_9BILA|nr:unnamed protein product [Rotaria sordida]CAF0731355.1 unnamed protein product [Rotaria sordida]CAF0735602.1 unnamed protein product [Rotaria sordida]CAF0795433.1 unnamed protein product [Rotaria sordida]CAF3483073.1 unnamed protein product [Rotaria sordida]
MNQATIDGRTTQLRKPYWLHSNNGYNLGDSFHQNPERKRQAGWGKRNYFTAEDDNDDILLHHIYGSHGDLAHNWFDDQ